MDCIAENRTGSIRSRGTALIAGGMLMLLGFAVVPARAAPLILEKVVVLMRHGVRPPTHEPALPAGYVDGAWPRWSVPPGYLTPHGAHDMTLLGTYDRGAYARRGLLPVSGCPATGTVVVWSDTDQRTEKSGDAWLAGFAPGCDVTNGHLPSGRDPLFSTTPATQDAAPLPAMDPATLAGIVSVNRDLLQSMQFVMQCCSIAVCRSAGLDQHCTLPDLPTQVVTSSHDHPHLVGALGIGAAMSEDLLCEFAEGRPDADVGWGRANQATVTRLLRLHALEYAIVGRPLAISGRAAFALARRVVDELANRSDPDSRMVVLVGHDTNIATLGGLLGLHWFPPGMAADDPPFGSQLGFELLRDPASGDRFVRPFFQTQTLSQLRASVVLDPMHPPVHLDLSAPDCGGDTTRGCSLEAFTHLVAARTAANPS